MVDDSTSQLYIKIGALLISGPRWFSILVFLNDSLKFNIILSYSAMHVPTLPVTLTALLFAILKKSLLSLEQNSIRYPTVPRLRIALLFYAIPQRSALSPALK